MTTTNWISSSFYGTFLKLPWRRNFWSRKQIAKVYVYKLSFPGSSHSKDSAYNSGDMDSILGYRRSPGEGNGNPLQYSCLRIPWTEEPGRLQSIGSQRVEHYWIDLAWVINTGPLTLLKYISVQSTLGDARLTCPHHPTPGDHTHFFPLHSHKVEEMRCCTWSIPELQFGKEIGFIFLTLSFTG